jgi:hypothetical protein
MLVSIYIQESGSTLAQAPKLGAKYTLGKGRTVLEILFRGIGEVRSQNGCFLEADAEVGAGRSDSSWRLEAGCRGPEVGGRRSAISEWICKI